MGAETEGVETEAVGMVVVAMAVGLAGAMTVAQMVGGVE